MIKVTTDYMKCYKQTSKTPLSELAKYTEKISKSLKDDYKTRFNTRTCFQQLGLIKEQAKVLIPVLLSEKHKESRVLINKIA